MAGGGETIRRRTMNKIYKVIWSKVRNCYVAVSEIAKRNGKSSSVVGGVVVGGAKAKGKCTALTLAFALCVTGGAVFTMPQVASADGGTITVTDASGPTTDGGGLSSVNIVNIVNGNRTTYYYPSDSAITTLNITGGTTWNGFIGYYSDSNSVSGHKVIVSGGTVNANVYGGYSAGSGAVTNNTVTISKTDTTNPSITGTVYGGYTQNGTAGGEGTTEDPYQNGNKVTITGGTINSGVCGGWSKNGTAIYNQVSISGGTVIANVYGGYSELSGEVTNNTVTISKTDTTVPNINVNVYGGYSAGSGTVGGEGTTEDPYQNGNKVNISGGTVNSWVYGGYSSSGAARYNTIEISGGDSNIVCGGRGITDATGNKVTITGGTIKSEVYGGYSFDGKAINNQVSINGGTVNGNVYGGYSELSGEVTNNTVTISKTDTTVTNINGMVYGGYSSSGIAKKNIVEISGGTITKTVYGGYSQSGTAGGEVTDTDPYKNGNKVSISGGTVNYWVYGGCSNSGAARYNTIEISGGTITNMVYGGRGATDTTGNKVTITGGTISSSQIYGGFTDLRDGITSVAAKGNAVTIEGGDFKNTNTAIYGGFTDGHNASGNAVTISTTINVALGAVYGGYVYNNSTGTAGDSAAGNVVTINGGVVELVYGGLTQIGTAGGEGTTEDPYKTGNKVTITGGEVGTVFGGSSNNGTAINNQVSITGGEVKTVYGGSSGNGTASNNRVTISGGTVNGKVYGGKGVEANNNTVEISVENFRAAHICVGDGATSTGNTLVLGAKGVEVSGAQGVGGVQIIALTDKVQFENNTTVLKADKFAKDNKTAVNAANFDGTLDISAATGLQGATAPGVMTLLQSDTEDNFTILSLKYKDATGSEQTANLSGETTSHIVREVAAQEDERANGVKLVYRNTHTVSVAGVGEKTKNAVNYTVGNVIGSIDLAQWDSTKDAVAVPTGWDKNAAGVTVATENMSEPGMEAGTSKVILTTDTANYFSDAKISETNKYKEYNFTPSAASGVTLSGKQSKGVRTAENGKKLEYAVGKMLVSDVSFGEMKWGTGRAATTDYDFANTATVKATDLSFTFTDEQKAALSKTSKMTLLSDATNLAADKTVTGESRTQQVDYSVANGAALTGTLTGTVSTAAGAVNYEATGMTLNSVDLAKWDGTKDAVAVPTGWTANTSGVTIETDGMSVPEVEAGKHIDILQSKTDNFFANAKINGDNAYKASDFTEKAGAITFAGSQSKGVTMDSKQNCLIYAAGTKDVKTATLAGEIGWDTSKAYYTNSQYTFGDSSNIVFANDSAFVSDTDPLNTSMTLIGPDSAEHAVKGTISGTPGFTVTMNNTTLDATVTGAASIESGNLKYTVTGVTLNKVTVDGVGSDAVPEGWSTAENLTVDTSSMTVPSGAAYGQPQNIMTSDKPVFDDNNITGSNKYAPAAFTDTDSKETPAVTVAGTQNAGVKASADKKSLVYEVGKKEASAITLGAVTWAAGTELLQADSEEYDYSSVKSVDAGSFVVKFDAPENVDASKGESMTLLRANETLADMAEQEKKTSYSYTPVTGVTINANITGKLANKSGAVTFTPSANQAGKLTFTNVNWKDSGALLTRPKNITFSGADVDTAKINFTNITLLDANKQMTLVSDFGDSVGTITGTKYRVGAALEGEGAASLSGSDLVFTTKTEARDLTAQEQTHNTLMVMEAGMAVLAAGNEYVGQTMAELGNPQNAAVDGTVTAASLGGSKSRYKTGSHVDSNSWNVAVAVGSKRELTKGSLEWGIFGEYGKSNYTLHSDAGRGDGDSHYAGGGLMAKWTNKHDVYTEASVRLGRLNDTANNLLRDAAGNGYGYDVHANYFGAHVGLGKIIHYKGGKSLDVYGKYFYTKRDGVDFTSGGNNYSLDSVASSILRVGARYGTTDKKWNWYGGLAYEYEFDGKSEGTVDGIGIRAASVKGGSVRGEIGMRMSATKTNPWQTDISIYGYGGKHRGFGGSVNVAYMF